MKTITKAKTIYVAFDGKEFDNVAECANYEFKKSKESVVNLRNFAIDFPLADSYSSYHAYLIHSENEFKMLKTYILSAYGEVYDEDINYIGNGWYVLQGEDSGYATLHKLSEIIELWGNALNKIAKLTMDFEN